MRNIIYLLFLLRNALALTWLDPVNVLGVGELVVQFTSLENLNPTKKPQKSASTIAVVVSGQVRSLVEPLVQKHLALMFVSELHPSVFWTLTLNNHNDVPKSTEIALTAMKTVCALSYSCQAEVGVILRVTEPKFDSNKECIWHLGYFSQAAWLRRAYQQMTSYEVRKNRKFTHVIRLRPDVLVRSNPLTIQLISSIGQREAIHKDIIYARSYHPVTGFAIPNSFLYRYSDKVSLMGRESANHYFTVIEEYEQCWGNDNTVFKLFGLCASPEYPLTDRLDTNNISSYLMVFPMVLANECGSNKSKSSGVSVCDGVDPLQNVILSNVRGVLPSDRNFGFCDEKRVCGGIHSCYDYPVKPSYCSGEVCPLTVISDWNEFVLKGKKKKGV